MSTTFKPSWDIYKDEFIKRKHGLPVWDPDPFLDDELRLGDVGYMRRGKFCKIPLQSDFMSSIEDILRQGRDDATHSLVWSNASILHMREPYVSSTVHQVEVALEGQTSMVTQLGASAGLRFVCSSSSGAVLNLSDQYAVSEDADDRTIQRLGDYMLANRNQFENEAQTRGLKLIEIILITGFHKTRDWETAVFSRKSSHYQGSLAANVPPFAEGSISFSSSAAHGLSVEYNMGHKHADMIANYVPSGRFVETCCQAGGTPPQTQGIFLRGLRLHKLPIIRVPKVIKAAAEPKDPEWEDADHSSALVVGIDNEINGTEESQDIYVEVAEALAHMTDGGYILVHDIDVIRYLEARDAEDHSGTLVSASPLQPLIHTSAGTFLPSDVTPPTSSRILERPSNFTSLHNQVAQSSDSLTSILDWTGFLEIGELVKSENITDVYRGKWVNLPDTADLPPRVSIKVVKGRKLKAEDMWHSELPGLARELAIWQELEHPNVLPLVGVLDSHEELGLVSPWVEYRCVINYLKENPEADRHSLLRGTALGIQYLHEYKPEIVHGDINANNIFVDYRGEAVIADAGLYRVISEDDGHWKTPAISSWASKWQPPEFMTMEQLLTTPASDVYAYAMTSFEIMSDPISFVELRYEAAVFKALMNDRKPNKPHSELIVDDLWDIWTDCWTKKPSNRPPIREVVRRLNLIGTSV